MATEQVFQSEEEAQKVIDATDWNLVTALIYACKEADRWEEEHKNKQQKNEEEIMIVVRTLGKNTHIVTGKQIGRASCRERV